MPPNGTDPIMGLLQSAMTILLVQSGGALCWVLLIGTGLSWSHSPPIPVPPSAPSLSVTWSSSLALDGAGLTSTWVNADFSSYRTGTDPREPTTEEKLPLT